MSEVETGEKKDAPGASGSPASGEGAPGKGEKKVTVDQGFIDRLVSERDETKEILAAMKAEVEELKAMKSAPQTPEPPEPQWSDPTDAKVGSLEKELQGLKEREAQREAREQELTIKGEYLEREEFKAVWPKWTDLQADLKSAAKGYGLNWDSLSASRREAVYNKVMRENTPKIVEAVRKSASVMDMDIDGGLPRGGAPKPSDKKVTLTALQKTMARKLIGDSPEAEAKYAKRLKANMDAAEALEV